MKIKIHYIVFTIALLISNASFAAPFSQMYVFGDSLSDTGNLASVTAAFPSPPTFGNRASNGIVAVEVLASSLGINLESSLHLIGAEQGGNYSFAGARAGGTGPGDLPTQLAIFLTNHSGTAPADALYVIFIGGNDIRDARSQSEKEFAYSLIDTASDALEAQLSILLAAGAKSVLVVNGPDIGRVPETRILATALQNPNLVKFSSKISKRFNKNLKKSVKSLEKTFSVDIVDFNFFDTLNLIIKNNLALGFNNATDACFSFVNLSFYPGCDSSFFATNVFFDELHLTARSHERIGRAMYAVVPEVL